MIKVHSGRDGDEWRRGVTTWCWQMVDCAIYCTPYCTVLYGYPSDDKIKWAFINEEERFGQ